MIGLVGKVLTFYMTEKCKKNCSGDLVWRRSCKCGFTYMKVALYLCTFVG